MYCKLAVCFVGNCVPQPFCYPPSLLYICTVLISCVELHVFIYVCNQSHVLVPYFDCKFSMSTYIIMCQFSMSTCMSNIMCTLYVCMYKLSNLAILFFIIHVYVGRIDRQCR